MNPLKTIEANLAAARAARNPPPFIAGDFINALAAVVKFDAAEKAAAAAGILVAPAARSVQ